MIVGKLIIAVLEDVMRCPCKSLLFIIGFIFLSAISVLAEPRVIVDVEIALPGLRSTGVLAVSDLKPCWIIPTDGSPPRRVPVGDVLGPNYKSPEYHFEPPENAKVWCAVAVNTNLLPGDFPADR